MKLHQVVEEDANSIKRFKITVKINGNKDVWTYERAASSALALKQYFAETSKYDWFDKANYKSITVEEDE